MDDLSEQLSHVIKNLDEKSRENLVHGIVAVAQMSAHDPCWCNNGKIYKYCHLNRNSERKINEGELRKQLSKIFDSKKYCCATFDNINCNLPIKGAHTIQRGRVLSSIAKDGHVGTFYRNIKGFDDIRNLKSGIEKKASIFYGFCSYHDTELFKDIEINEFTISAKNSWASSYRAVCHEYYQKNAAKEAVVWKIENLDKGCDLLAQLIIQEKMLFLKRDINKGFEDISFIKDKYEHMFKTKNYGMLTSYIVELDEPLKLAVCASISPSYNVNGVKFQNLGDPNILFQHFSLSTVTIDGNSAYVISHLKEHEDIGIYLKDVFSRDYSFVKSWLLQSIFAYTENCYFDLLWWELLDQNLKDKIYKLAMSENYTKHFDIDSEISSKISGTIINVSRI